MNDARAIPTSCKMQPVAEQKRNHRAMLGLLTSPTEQALKNTREAIRAAGLLPRGDSTLIPHPNDLLLAELRNVERYLVLALEDVRDSHQCGA